MRYIFITVFCLLAPLAAMAQVIQASASFKTPAELKESSGLALFGSDLISHNDSGDSAVLYVIDRKAGLRHSIRIRNAVNRDWEEITSDRKGTYFIGDFGNNANKRKDLAIYRVKLTASDKEAKAETIRFSYADQPAFPPSRSRLDYDAEAMVWWKDTLFVFSKNNAKPYNGYVRMYKIPAVPGEYQVMPADSFYTGKEGYYECSITGAALNAAGNRLVLISYNRLWLFTEFSGSAFFRGNYARYDFDKFSQKEAVCFDEQDNLWVTDERSLGLLGGRLYYYPLRDYASGFISYTSQSVKFINLRADTTQKGTYQLNYTFTEKGDYRMLITDEKGTQIVNHILPLSETGAPQSMALQVDENTYMNGTLRVFLGNRMVYAYRLRKMNYE